MTVLDLGCGPGFFTVDIADMVGRTGKVIAVDVPQEAIFDELSRIIKDNGYLFIVEPKLFHVSRSDFERTIGKAAKYGFVHVENKRILFSRGAILRKCQPISSCLDVAG